MDDNLVDLNQLELNTIFQQVKNPELTVLKELYPLAMRQYVVEKLMNNDPLTFYLKSIKDQKSLDYLSNEVNHLSDLIMYDDNYGYCERCELHYYIDRMVQCGICDEWHCEDCTHSIECLNCNRSIDTEGDFTDCFICDQPICSDCKYDCDNCSVPICSVHNTKICSNCQH